MNLPKTIRKQADAYRAAGFHIVEVEHRAGSHFKVRFAEFATPIVLTANVGDPRAIKNNVALLRRIARGRA